MVKLICIDLDGTLLDSDQNVSIRNKQSLIRALDQGILIYFVTGRPYAFTKHIAESIDERIQVVSSNGATYELDGTMI